MTTLAGVKGVLPAHSYAQEQLTEAFTQLCLGSGTDPAVVHRLHGNSQVRTRHLALPLEEYPLLKDFGAANDAFLKVAEDLGSRAVTEALTLAGLEASDVDLIISTTVTGIAAPSIDARIAGRIGLRPDVRRVPLFGLGCVAGAAGIGRMHDYLLGHPNDVAVLLSVELCSLTVQRDDRSMPNLIASGLFGDGAAAVVAVGSQRDLPGPRVVDARSHLYPNTLRTMGWDVGASGLKIVLDAEVPRLITDHLGDDVRRFLADHGLTIEDVSTWVSHPGGPKVIEAIIKTLGLPADALDLTWKSLAESGNLSSSSVLHVLQDTLALREPPAGTPGVLMAMGPGFCSELILLEW